MTTELFIGTLGMFLMAGIAMWGRRKPVSSVDEWAVAGRKYGILTTWVLQAGETFTTFTFLGTVGIVIVAGGSAYYVIPYIPLAYLVMYWIAPRIWRQAKAQGYLGQADFLAGVYKSRPLGLIVAVLGVLFLLPYLQLQIHGLGLIIDAATGGRASSEWSTVIGFVLVIAFVVWSGLRGIASVSYFKDAMMLIVMFLLMISIPMHFNGGLFGNIERVAQEAPEMLYAPSGPYGPAWVITSMAISMIGVMFYALPHTWPPVLASRSERVVRRNLIYLPIYSGLASIPMLLGYVAIRSLDSDGDPDSAMLRMAAEALPSWVVGIVLVTAAATAMVPSAALLIAMSPMVTTTIVRPSTERGKMMSNRATVVLLGAGALVLALALPDLLAQLLLLTFSGSSQVVPAIVAALLLKRRPETLAVIAGMLAGVGTVIVLAFGFIEGPSINEGITGLVVNVAVLLLVQAGLVLTGRRSDGTRADAPVPEPVTT